MPVSFRCVFSSILLTATVASGANERPNILLVMADDQGSDILTSEEIS